MRGKIVGLLVALALIGGAALGVAWTAQTTVSGNQSHTNWPGANQVGNEPTVQAPPSFKPPPKVHSATESACYYSHNAKDKPRIVLASCSNAPVFSVVVTPNDERYIMYVAYMNRSANVAAYFWCGQNYSPYYLGNTAYDDCLFMVGGFGSGYSYPIIQWLSAAGDTTSFNWEDFTNRYVGWLNIYKWGQ